MSTQGIAPGLACRPSAWGDRDCDSGRRDSCVVVRAQIVSCESSFVTLAGHGSGSWSGNDAPK